MAEKGIYGRKLKLVLRFFVLPLSLFVVATLVPCRLFLLFFFQFFGAVDLGAVERQ